MILSRIPSWKPVITASTTMRAATPRKTPPTPIHTNKDRFVRCPGRADSAGRGTARRGARPSRDPALARRRGLGPEMREQDDLADRRRVGEEHHETVD